VFYKFLSFTLLLRTVCEILKEFVPYCKTEMYLGTPFYFAIWERNTNYVA
jgi:hypothetical protein